MDSEFVRWRRGNARSCAAACLVGIRWCQVGRSPGMTTSCRDSVPRSTRTRAGRTSGSGIRAPGSGVRDPEARAGKLVLRFGVAGSDRVRNRESPAPATIRTGWRTARTVCRAHLKFDVLGVGEAEVEPHQVMLPLRKVDSLPRPVGRLDTGVIERPGHIDEPNATDALRQHRQSVATR